jgi:hypothetical protein
MQRLGDDARRLLREAGIPEAGDLAEIVRAWPAAVGPAIARAAWPARIGRDGTLHVAVATAAWAQELTLLADELRATLVRALGERVPEHLRFTVGPVPAPGAEEPPVRAVPPPTNAEDAELAAAVASAIDDPELRETARRAVLASLSARRADHPV